MRSLTLLATILLCCPATAADRRRGDGQQRRRDSRRRGADRWAKLREDVYQALAFPSVEEAEFHRGQMLGSPDEYEICELTPDGRITPVQLP
jgi:hypothetical protein